MHNVFKIIVKISLFQHVFLSWKHDGFTTERHVVVWSYVDRILEIKTLRWEYVHSARFVINLRWHRLNIIELTSSSSFGCWASLTYWVYCLQIPKLIILRAFKSGWLFYFSWITIILHAAAEQGDHKLSLHPLILMCRVVGSRTHVQTDTPGRCSKHRYIFPKNENQRHLHYGRWDTWLL